MFESQTYFRVLLSLIAALVTLLGSVGIFVSLIVQRRVERLQDILEEFLDLSYHEDINLTGRMFRLIEKYQMHYLLPSRPVRALLQYINLTIFIVIITWFVILMLNYRPPFNLLTVALSSPIVGGLGVMIFYRHLLKNVVNPIDNDMLSPIIPPPAKLRSVSYLSRHVNVSVKSILKHARLRLVIKENVPGNGKVLLKEEISFDNYFYYIRISDSAGALFVGFGEIKMDFGHEPVTGKPIPVVRNVNIPLGNLQFAELREKELQALLLIFTIGEKHPIQYKFNLHYHQNIFQISEDPEISINYMVTYQIKGNRLQLLKMETEATNFTGLKNYYQLNRERYFWLRGKNSTELIKYDEPIFVD